MTMLSKSVDDEQQELTWFSTSRQLAYFAFFGRQSRLRVGFVIQVLNEVFGDAVEKAVADQSIQIVSTDAKIRVDGHVTERLNTASPVHNFAKQSSLARAT